MFLLTRHEIRSIYNYIWVVGVSEAEELENGAEQNICRKNA